MPERDVSPAALENPDGAGPFVILCDHASSRVPAEYHSLGLPAEALDAHFAWDPGALPVARALAKQLEAPLVWPDVSRLVIDCNRDPSAPDLIVAEGDGRPVPGNRDVAAGERARRLNSVHVRYHAAIDACIDRRLAAGLSTALVAIHSFTPTWRGNARPWEIGIVFDEYRRLADAVIERLRTDRALTVGINQPYSPADRVYYTLARHGTGRGLPAVMIEIRNDEVATAADQSSWASRLAAILSDAAPKLFEAGHAAA